MVNDIWQMLSLGSVPVRPTTDRLAACLTIVLQSLSSQSKAESLSKSLEWDSIFFRKSQGAPGQAVASASCRCGAPHGRDGQAVASASCRCGVPHGRDGQGVASASCRWGAPHGRDGQGSGIGILPMWRTPRARRPCHFKICHVLESAIVYHVAKISSAEAPNVKTSLSPNRCLPTSSSRICASAAERGC